MQAGDRAEDEKDQVVLCDACPCLDLHQGPEQNRCEGVGELDVPNVAVTCGCPALRTQRTKTGEVRSRRLSEAGEKRVLGNAGGLGPCLMMEGLKSVWDWSPHWKTCCC